jgi:hypothetical protein
VEPLAPVETATASDAREMSEALDELAWDIDRWLLLLPNPRLPEARQLLRKVDKWVLLSTCDHDGVVSCYRAIKGLAEMPRPRLTLALLNAADEVEAGKVHRKIAGVCEQFLNWKMEAEAAVEPTDGVTENLTLSFCPPRDRAEAGAGAQWDVVEAFLVRAMQANEAPAEPVSELEQIEAEVQSIRSRPIAAEPIVPQIAAEPKAEGVVNAVANRQPAVVQTPEILTTPVIEQPPVTNRKIPAEFKAEPVVSLGEDDGDVLELPGGEVTEASVLAAVISKSSAGLVQCPIHPPACPQAVVAVGRDHRLVLLAVARRGLGELRAIAAAYRWVIENRPLLTMALSQFAIDAHAHPSLKLVVDRADAGADLLLPMAQQGNVTVQTYRKLRWAGKTGLLLEAA